MQFQRAIVCVGIVAACGVDGRATIAPVTIAVHLLGSGRVTSDPAGLDCTNHCSAVFPAGTSVALRASPSAGNAFVGWSGACSGVGACTVSDSAELGASFAPGEELSVLAVGAELPNIRLESHPIRIFIRQWVKFSARASDAKAARVTWSVQEGEAAGRISVDGTYTAPSQPGTYHVVAASLDDPAARGQIAVEVVTTQNLYDYGGRILPAPKLLLVWRGTSDDFDGAIPLFERFLAGVNGSSWLAILDQYMRGDRASLSVAGELTAAAVPSDETDAESALCTLLATHGLNPEAGTIYAVLSPVAAQPFDHHSSVICKGVRVPVIAVSLRRDAARPAGACTEALSAAERMLWAFSHELAETVTDPEPLSGWTDLYGQEVADDCAMATCQTFATGSFSLTSLLSNSGGGCAP